MWPTTRRPLPSRDSDWYTCTESMYSSDGDTTTTFTASAPAPASASTPDAAVKGHGSKNNAIDDAGFQRYSLTIRYERHHVARLASELYDETIASTELALFTTWVLASAENIALATEYVRELRLDQGYSIRRVSNPFMKQFLIDTMKHRRPEPRYLLTPEEFKHVRIISKYARARGIKQDDDEEQKKKELSSGMKAKKVFSLARLGPRETLLPKPVWKKRNKMQMEASREVSLASLVSSRKYPPNTPDRPAPLRIRSASNPQSPLPSPLASGPSSVSSPTVLRSFSSPLTIIHETQVPLACSEKKEPSPTSASTCTSAVDTNEILKTITQAIAGNSCQKPHSDLASIPDTSDLNGPSSHDTATEGEISDAFDLENAIPKFSLANPIESLNDAIKSALELPDFSSDPEHIVDQYREIATEHVKYWLDKTLSYGQSLELVVWAELVDTDKSWRLQHEKLLAVILGCAEVDLTDEEKRSVDEISRRLTDCKWLHNILLGEA